MAIWCQKLKSSKVCAINPVFEENMISDIVFWHLCQEKLYLLLWKTSVSVQAPQILICYVPRRSKTWPFAGDPKGVKSPTLPQPQRLWLWLWLPGTVLYLVQPRTWHPLRTPMFLHSCHLASEIGYWYRVCERLSLMHRADTAAALPVGCPFRFVYTQC